MDYIADDDPRPSDPLDFYTSDLLRGLLGRFHDKVKDSALLIERYRGRFPGCNQTHRGGDWQLLGR
jgi:hypothetical protein